MSNLRQAAQQALEVLERAGEELRWQAIGQVQRDLRAALEQPSTAVRYSRKELNEFEQMQDGTWEADRNG